MRTILAGLLLLTVSACAPTRTAVQVSWGPNPWYNYCSWEAPCWYSDNLVFVYRWGYVDRPTYVYLLNHPDRREAWAHRRRDWHPRNAPEYRGRDWDAYKTKRDADHHDRRKHPRSE